MARVPAASPFNELVGPLHEKRAAGSGLKPAGAEVIAPIVARGIP
jgi:hypothetical protein